MENNYLLGIDIGGTKCAVSVGLSGSDKVKIIEKTKFDTISGSEYIKTVGKIIDTAKMYAEKYSLLACGISCGSPLDIKNGIIKEPPNLPGWIDVPIVSMLGKQLGIPAAIRNDADACAIAEYLYGAGRGCTNMAFLTFGTGMGAGLILNGKLYTGKSGTAGEVGHIRLEKDGPTGYGKRGSFEGFCSGGGIAQLARLAAEGDDKYRNVELTAKTAAMLALNGDEKMLGVYNLCADKLGSGLAVLVDILDLDVIVIGSVYARSEKLLYDGMMKALKREALPMSLEGLKILPAALGESLGDAAALAVAQTALEESLAGK